MKKIIIIGFVLILLTSIFTNLSHADQIDKSGNEWTYILKYTDVEQEIRRQYIGETQVPWTDGFVGQQFDSQIVTSHDGFCLPDEFFTHWQYALTQSLVNYWNFTENGGFDFGWVYYHSADCSGEDSFIKFKTPLRLWTIGETYVKSTAAASIMKFDTIGLFTPEEQEKGKPELEGKNVTATFTSKTYRTQENQMDLNYSLIITGYGIMRFFDAHGPFLGEDKNESCNLSITRNGTITFMKDYLTKIWYVLQECYTEVWYAHSLTSTMTVSESSFGGHHERYTFFLSELPEREPVEVPVFDVTEYGAIGDGITLDTIAINTAIETCANHNGGIVYFPPGIYLTGSLHLQSNVTLSVGADAVLRGTRDMSKYDPLEYNPWSEYQDTSESYMHRSLIWGENLSNIGILGPGLIDGNDAFEPWPIINRTVPPPFGWLFCSIFNQATIGIKPLALKSCVNIFIKDIMITHAPNQAIFVAGCDNVIIMGYMAQAVRVDGINPVCCRNVTITSCEIRSFDDAVAIKSSYILGYKQSCENITIRNCLLCSICNALKIGTESVGDFRNISYRDCIVRNSPLFPSLAGISVISEDGAVIDGVTASDITLYDVDYPIFIRLGNRLRSPEHPSIGKIQNISIQNLTAVNGMKASSITAVPDSDVGGNIIIHNMTIMCRGGGRRIYSARSPLECNESKGIYPDPYNILPGPQPAYGFFCRHVKGLSFYDVSLGFQYRDLRAAVICEDIDGFLLARFKAERSFFGAPSVIIR